MTEKLKQKAFNFLEKHTYYDECKGTHYRDLTEIELLVLFAEEVTKELQEENKKIFNDWIEACDKYGEANLKLIKAKDILRRLMANQLTPSDMYEDADLVGWREVNEEAEQFISEVEK